MTTQRSINYINAQNSSAAAACVVSSRCRPFTRSCSGAHGVSQSLRVEMETEFRKLNSHLTSRLSAAASEEHEVIAE